MGKYRLKKQLQMHQSLLGNMQKGKEPGLKLG
jgi:hypothetical protein